MLRASDEVQDLKRTLFECKKELAGIKEMNQILKVKNRKQQNELHKKDQQIESLLDPTKQSNLAKKLVAERSAAVVMKLKDEKIKLEKALTDKEVLINRLRRDIQTLKIYSTQNLNGKKKYGGAGKKNEKNEVTDVWNGENFIENSPKGDIFRVRSLSLSSIKNSETHPDAKQSNDSFKSTETSIVNLQKTPDNKGQYEGLSRDELISMVENLKLTRNFNDAERNENLCESPHQEVQQLQGYFLEMLEEVSQLKGTISVLRVEQEKTSSILKEKESSESLAKVSRNAKKSMLVAPSTGTKKRPQSATVANYKDRQPRRNEKDRDHNCNHARNTNQKATSQVAKEEICTQEQRNTNRSSIFCEEKRQIFNSLLKQILKQAIITPTKKPHLDNSRCSP